MQKALSKSSRTIFYMILSVLFLHSVAYAQSLTYHLHKEASTTTGRLQLKTAGPDAAATNLVSANLKNQLPGEYLINAFDTQAGVPNASGVIPAGSSVTFTLWMKKSANVGTIYPRVKLNLNSSTGTSICIATGSTPLTTTLTKYALSCTTPADVSMAKTDRFYLWTGINMTTGPGGSNLSAQLSIEGTLNGNYDSLITLPSPTPLPPPPIAYIYDELGRLKGVVDPAGDTTVYNYDAVGNLLSITRNSSAQVSIIDFTPKNGPVGTNVTIYGAGFSTTPAQNTVTFNGVLATVSSSTVTQIITSVPSGAITGPITVTTPSGSATSGTPFTVTSAISISIDPTKATVVSGTSKQFTATITGTADQGVTWSIEGNGTLPGTLSNTGLYSVPSNFADTAQVFIRATSLADTTKSVTAIVDVLPSVSSGPFVAPQISVAISQSSTPTGPFVAPQVSVAIAQVQSSTGPFVAPQVSVGIAQASTSTGPFVAPQVSVSVDQTTSTSGPFTAPQVSAAIDQGSGPSGPFEAPQVSVSLIPIINSISPNSGAQGATNLPITITGRGLAGASSISFLLNGAVDTTITASNITANAEGTQVTAQFTISGTASTGLRVVRITTANGTSPAAMMEGNTFMITTP